MPTSRLRRIAESRSWPNGFSMTIRRQPPSWRSWSRPDPAQLGDDLGELRRLGGEVEEPVAAGPALLVELVEARAPAPRTPPDRRSRRGGRGSAPRARPTRRVDGQDARVTRRATRDLRPERLVRVRAPADGDERELVRQQVRPPQLVERGDDLAVGEVAGRAEQHEDGRVRHALQAEALAQGVVEGLAAGARRRVAAARRSSLIVRGASFFGAPVRRRGGRRRGGAPASASGLPAWRVPAWRRFAALGRGGALARSSTTSHLPMYDLPS